MANIHNLENWLKNNVLRVTKPHKLDLHSFKVDLATFIGSFRVEVEGVTIASPFGCYLDIDGEVHFREPVFHSPLGVPASYSAVDLDPQTRLAITNSIRDFFPKFRPFGFHKDINRMIAGDSALQERVLDEAGFSTFCLNISAPGLRLSVIG